MYSILITKYFLNSWGSKQIHYISYRPYLKLCTVQSENLVGKK